MKSQNKEAYEARQCQSVSREQSAAQFRRPLLRVPQIEDRLRHRGGGRSVCRDLRSEGAGGDDRRFVRAPLRRARSLPNRIAVARELWLWIHSASRSVAG